MVKLVLKLLMLYNQLFFIYWIMPIKLYTQLYAFVFIKSIFLPISTSPLGWISHVYCSLLCFSFEYCCYSEWVTHACFSHLGDHAIDSAAVNYASSGTGGAGRSHGLRPPAGTAPNSWVLPLWGQVKGQGNTWGEGFHPLRAPPAEVSDLMLLSKNQVNRH